MNAYAKAVFGALVAFNAAFLLAIADASAGGETVVTNEWVIIGVTTLTAAIGVWAVPNTGTDDVDWNKGKQ